MKKQKNKLKKEKNICNCEGCQKEATFFHSRCCNSHFEGVIDNGYRIIVCENCGRYVGDVIIAPKKENKKYKI